MFVDSHAHLTCNRLLDTLDGVLERAEGAAITSIINICTDEDSLQRGIELAQRCPWVYNVAATTPHDVDQEGESFFPLVVDAVHKKHLVAIGETGLDYYYTHSEPETQKHFLIRYLHLALESSLPVVIHCRDAFEDFFAILDAEYRVKGVHAPGVLHCFTGTLSEAKEVIKRGWYLSLSGIVTYKKSEALRDVAAWVPLEQLFIETDTPYLAPQSKRGKTNEPSYMPETARVIAEVKGISCEEVAKATAHNTRTLFQISAAKE